MKFMRILMALGAFFTHVCFCNENDSAQEFINQQIGELVGNQDSSIVDYVEHRCYLNPDRLSINNKEIRLITDDGKLIPLALLAVDELGVYTTLSRVSDTSSTIYPVIRCRNCGFVFTPTVFNRGRCPSCQVQN